MIRSSLDAAAVDAGVHAIVANLDAGLIANVRRLEDNFEFWRTLSRLAGGLSFALGALALALASIGISGVMTAVVGGRTREIGVRLALGASKRDILSMVLRKSMTPVFVGALVGAGVCVAVARLLAGLLFGVSALDPYALAGALVESEAGLRALVGDTSPVPSRGRVAGALREPFGRRHLLRVDARRRFT